MNLSRFGPLFVFGAFLATLVGYIVLAITSKGAVPLETLENILIGLGSALAALAIPQRVG
jgi:hypothetical protein